MCCSFISELFTWLLENLTVLLRHCCLRCTECHSTLLPGSYKIGSESGSLVCTHHLPRQTLASQNGRPDLSTKPAAVQSARISRSTVPHTSPCKRDQAETPTLVSQTNDMSTSDSVTATPATAGSLEKVKEIDGSGETEEKSRSSSPPNPFDESDEEEEEAEKTEDTQTPAKCTANGDLPSTPDSRPVPAPRRVSEPTPPPRPAPRIRLPRASDGLIAGACLLQKINAYKYMC